MTETMTFTELDVDERRDLLERVEAIEPGDEVRVRYDSSRSDDYVEAEGQAMPASNVPLLVDTDDLKGDLFVKVLKMESRHHPGMIARTTGSAFSNQQPRLGELIDVTVLTDEPESGDRVRFVDPLPEMPDQISALEGETAEVRSVGNGGSTYGRACVDFDDVDERHWLPIDRLVLVGDRDE